MVDIIVGQPVVIDNGSGAIKAGLAGDQAPKAVFSNMVGRVKYDRVMAGGLEGDTFVGRAAQENRGVLALSYPMEHGIVTNWDDMKLVWDHVYSQDQLGIAHDEHPVLLTEAPLNPLQNREKTAEIFFETFNAPALYIQIQAVLALYASGRTTGVVLDSGDGVTHIVPIVNGLALTHQIERLDLAGRDVTRHLQQLLRKEGMSFTRSNEFEIVREMKERVGYLALDPDKEESKAERVQYEMPDGVRVPIGASRFRAPEILIHPHRIGLETPGLPAALNKVIRACDPDIRKTLYENVLLSGGTTLTAGFGDRMTSELKRLAPEFRIRLMGTRDRLYNTWIGGSILASLDVFRKLYVTKQEWLTDGRRTLHRKFF